MANKEMYFACEIIEENKKVQELISQLLNLKVLNANLLTILTENQVIALAQLNEDGLNEAISYLNQYFNLFQQIDFYVAAEKKKNVSAWNELLLVVVMMVLFCCDSCFIYLVVSIFFLFSYR